MWANEKDFDRNSKKKLAKNDNEAKQRYKKFGGKDPFPEIAPALLNSVDIYKYVQKTGMIWPFNPELIRGATYPVKIGKTCTFYDDGHHVIDLEKEKNFVLKKNSLVFVELEPTFRVPEYMVLRFNLKIKHIYKGLLLGTGPIVDPGFCGKLYIPLHNLTMNEYTFEIGTELIELEFTKLSLREGCTMSGVKGIEGYWKKPDGTKVDRDISVYIRKALDGYIKGSRREVQNAIPHELKEMKTEIVQMRVETSSQLKIMRKKWQSFKYFWGKFGMLAFVGAIIGIGTLIYGGYALVVNEHNIRNDDRERVFELQTDINENSEQLKKVFEENKQLKAELERLEKELAKK